MAHPLGPAFQERRPRCGRATKADHEYRQQACAHYLIIPFTSNLKGLPMNVRQVGHQRLRVRRPPAVPGRFYDAEFFIAPPDFEWTMVHTHEDYSVGGPYFLRREWLG